MSLKDWMQRRAESYPTRDHLVRQEQYGRDAGDEHGRQWADAMREERNRRDQEQGAHIERLMELREEMRKQGL